MPLVIDNTVLSNFCRIGRLELGDSPQPHDEALGVDSCVLDSSIGFKSNLKLRVKRLSDVLEEM